MKISSDESGNALLFLEKLHSFSESINFLTYQSPIFIYSINKNRFLVPTYGQMFSAYNLFLYHAKSQTSKVAESCIMVNLYHEY